MIDFERLIASHCAAHGLTVSLSRQMPSGYETAFGTYVPETATLHLNAALLQCSPCPEALFYLYHELRHAEQYQHPERFSDLIVKSLPYVILYNGTCFRQVPGGWQHCQFHGENNYFTQAYLSLPYELDANEYACQQIEADASCASAAEKLRHLWIPRQALSPEELTRLFQRIDNAICP